MYAQPFPFKFRHLPILFITLFISILILSADLYCGSLDLAVNHTGISIGNSRRFNGLRINFRDSHVEEIKGFNITFWRPVENKKAKVTGISLGLVAPSAGYLHGVSVGGLGVSAEKELSGVAVAAIGVGSGGSISGFTFGGIGVGSGESISGITIGGIGAGSGGNISGITIGGLGAGAQGNIWGLTIGLLGVGSGESIKGITIGGLGAGASENISGITIGGIGAGCGGTLKGLTIGGVGAGAPVIKGATLGGIGAGAENIQGITLSLGMIKLADNGSYSGLAASSYNKINGQMNGLSIGVFNYAWKLKGVQLGLINYVRDNPTITKLLPLFNMNF